MIATRAHDAPVRHLSQTTKKAQDVRLGEVIEAGGELRRVTRIEQRQGWLVLLDRRGDCLIVTKDFPLQVVSQASK